MSFCFLSIHFRTSILFGHFPAFDLALKSAGKFARGHRDDNKSKKKRNDFSRVHTTLTRNRKCMYYEGDKPLRVLSSL